MAIRVACRGCRTPVALGAEFCFICRCPSPTCYVSHLLPTSVSTIEGNEATAGRSAASLSRLIRYAARLLQIHRSEKKNAASVHSRRPM